MNIINVTAEQLPPLKEFYPEDVYQLLLKQNAYAMAVITEDSTAAGTLAFSIQEDMLTILWVSVAPAYQRRGFCTMMYNRLLQLICDLNFISVIEVPMAGDEGNLERFLIRMGYQFEEDNISVCIGYLKDFLENPLFKKSSDKENVMPLKELSRKNLNDVMIILEENFNLSPREINLMEDFDRELSGVYLLNNEIKSLLLTTVHKEIIELSFVFSVPGCSSSLFYLMNTMAEKAKDMYTEDMLLKMTLINETGKALAQKLLPDSFLLTAPIMVYYLDEP